MSTCRISSLILHNLDKHLSHKGESFLRTDVLRIKLQRNCIPYGQHKIKPNTVQSAIMSEEKQFEWGGLLQTAVYLEQKSSPTSFSQVLEGLKAQLVMLCTALWHPHVVLCKTATLSFSTTKSCIYACLEHTNEEPLEKVRGTSSILGIG